MTDVKIVEPAIWELLKGLASGAVYFLRAPQNAIGPFIVIQRTDSTRWRHINGPSGIAQAHIQIDCYDNTYYTAKALAASVETLLDGYDGIVYYGTNSPRESVEIGGISLQNDLDTLDQTDQPVLYRNISTFLVTYKQRD